MKLIDQLNVDKLEVADFRMIPNAKNGHKGKVFVRFPFSFFRFAWRGGDVKARHVAGHLPFGSIWHRDQREERSLVGRALVPLRQNAGNSLLESGSPPPRLRLIPVAPPLLM